MISLAGIPFTTLLWATAAGGGVITTLYLLRLRRRRVVVPYLPLWQKVIQNSQYQSLIQRFKRFISWLIQMIFWLFLIFALSDPRMRAELMSGRNVVVLVDHSASMAATDGSDKQSRLALAKKKAKKLIDGLIGFDRMMLVALDREVVPLTPFTTDKKLLLEKLKSMKTSETPASLRKGLLLAQDALQDRKRGEIIVISDGSFGTAYKELLVPLKKDKKKDEPTKKRKAFKAKAAGKTTSGGGKKPKKRKSTKKSKKGKKKAKQPDFKLPPGFKKKLDLDQYSKVSEEHRQLPRFQLVRVGKNKENVAIIAMSARRMPSHPLHFSMYIELMNFSKQPAVGFLELYVDSLLVKTVNVSLKSGQRMRHTFSRLTAQGQRLKVQMRLEKGSDLLPTDNQAYAVLPKTRAPSVLMVGEYNIYLHAALLSDPHIVYKHITCKQYDPKPGKHDIIIFNNCGSKKIPKHGKYIFFDPPPGEVPFKINSKKELKNPLITEVAQSHPTLRFVALKELNIASALLIKKERGDRVLADSFGKPLILLRKRAGMLAVVVGFSLKKTDLPLRVAFPLFLRNTLQWLVRGGRPVPPTTHSTGQLWKIQLPLTAKEVKITRPDNTSITLPVSDGIAHFSGKLAGFYRMDYKRTDKGKDEVRWLAANLVNPEESFILPRKMKPKLLKAYKQKTDKETSRSFEVLGVKLPIPKPIWLYLLLAAAVLLTLEWWTYNRRITV